ncbi:SgcJ/EcaC family oxidoreductase [Bremerella sp. JC817]|uniref:YybH family protein n=1 Tax=Bremerella sp. JC817 TaxID=3231756 RepID=UPI00345A00D4
MSLTQKFVRCPLIVFTALWILSAAALQAAEPVSSEADLAEIRTGADAFVKAFNQGNAKSIAKMWTVKGEYIDDTGKQFSGRAEIEAGYAKFFAENPGLKIRLSITSLRMVSDDVAIEEGRAEVEPPPAGQPGFTKYVVVHNKVDGKWLMASVRDSFTPRVSNYSGIAELEWLIGNWVAEEHGFKVESVCSWIGNKSFIERAYTITKHDGTKSSGVQLIGWNQATKTIQSWDFSPDGGHAIGTWFFMGSSWKATVHGVTADGFKTSAVNLLRPLDENAYSWKSVQRSLGDRALPDTDEIVIKRQPVAQ